MVCSVEFSPRHPMTRATRTHRFNVSEEKQGSWMLKLFDYFEVCKLAFGSSCSLNNLLMANGEDVKSSSGMQAVEWARHGQYRQLEEYCMQDTILTHKISCTEAVHVPLTGWTRGVTCIRGQK
jgi:hypothetical protein